MTHDSVYPSGEPMLSTEDMAVLFGVDPELIRAEYPTAGQRGGHQVPGGVGAGRAPSGPGVHGGDRPAGHGRCRRVVARTVNRVVPSAPCPCCGACGTVACSRCGRRHEGSGDWNATIQQGVVTGYLCPDCQTPTENAEAVINEATNSYLGPTEQWRLGGYIR